MMTPTSAGRVMTGFVDFRTGLPVRRPLQRGTKPLQRRKNLPARSPKRAQQERAYRKARQAFLADHPVCQRCQQHRATDLHHVAGRVGGLLLDVRYWRALCRPCHQWVTEHPVEAIHDGWSLLRVGSVEDGGDAA